MLSKYSLFAPLVAWAVALSACSTGEPEDDPIDRRLCTAEEVGIDFIELARGEFTPRDLADLSDDGDGRERVYEAAGMERGRFVYYKQALPRPPFEPPVDIVCQVIEFESPDQAADYADGLDSVYPAVQVAGIAWLPEDRHTVEDVEPGIRRITIDGVGRTVSVLVGFAAHDRYFTSVYVGSEGEPPTIETLRRLQAGAAGSAD